ncbi:putative metallophosphoesterase YsnB [Lentibacillus sp. JNUCC-1]|uniref:YfcE family phosphodiesterase n=1 Tax=Lentibacillus sp. JNUCC-1 TaxID=2654513 RepID=UPI0012E79B76|nr:metallophosphoesterase [Lentibacillus sp. JNUCC-1]MUV39405.1 putative metallophosphoesterase YsnB [Lentibacillus sp. JNUCC-1]
MKVLIVSDSHGLTQELSQIKQRHEVSAMIHCGDSELDMDAEELQHYIKVAGNCDFDSRYPTEQAVEIGDLVFYVTHGHLTDVNAGLLALSYRSKEYNADVVCFGHTHKAGAELVDEQLLINPGSIKQSRGKYEESYAILTWDSKSEIHVDFYSVDGRLLDPLSDRYTLHAGN